jgi:CubicO group peptidase (beta-lactamase class C family)
MKAIEAAVQRPKVDIKGTCSSQFNAVREAFAHNLDTGQDIGASVAICVDGEPVVDLWGGHFDGTYTRPFGRDTICQNYSSTKTITALCALYLADRGEIDLDSPVAKYWPEFAAEGKGGIVVRQLLGHTAALCGWSEPMTLRALYDWEKSTAMLARQAPLWKPGRTSGYHGFTQGHLVGEVVRRVTGKTIGRFLSEDVAQPLGVAEGYYIGTPEESDHRVSLLIQGAPYDSPNGNRFHDLSLYNPHVKPQDTWTIEWRRAELPAMGGHGSARGIATLQSLLASGGANGVRMMPTPAARESSNNSPMARTWSSACRVAGQWASHSRPRSSPECLPAPARPGGPATADRCRTSDLDARMSLGFVPNRWFSGSHETDRARNLVRAAYESLYGRH